MVRDRKGTFVLIAWSLWLIKLTIYSQTPININCDILRCTPAPDVWKGDSFSLGACSHTRVQAPEVWEGGHRSLLKAGSSALLHTRRSYQCSVNCIWRARRWEQSNISATSLDFSVVDLNQLIFRATLQLGRLCLLHKWFIWPWPLWILSSVRSLWINLWEGARCPAGIPGLLF